MVGQYVNVDCNVWAAWSVLHLSLARATICYASEGENTQIMLLLCLQMVTIYNATMLLLSPRCRILQVSRGIDDIFVSISHIRRSHLLLPLKERKGTYLKEIMYFSIGSKNYLGNIINK